MQMGINGKNKGTMRARSHCMKDFHNKFMSPYTLLLTLLFVGACKQLGGAGSIGSGGGSIDETLTLTMTHFQNEVPTDWLTDSTGVYTQSRDVEIKGDCSRGVDSIIVKIDGVASSTTATCSIQGKYTWSQSFSADGTYLVELFPATVKGVTTTVAAASETVIIDSTAPTAPVITIVDIENPYSGNATVTIRQEDLDMSGTIPADAVSMAEASSFGTLTVGSGTFSFEDVLTSGSTKNYSFTVTDFAGNTSSATTIAIAYASSTTMAKELNSGSAITTPITATGGVLGKLWHVSSSPIIMSPTSMTSSTGTNKLYTGIVSIGNN